MREQRNDPKRLKDILQAIDTIFEYVGDRGMRLSVGYDVRINSREGAVSHAFACKDTKLSAN